MAGFMEGLREIVSQTADVGGGYEVDYRAEAELVAAAYERPDSTITDEAALLRGILFALLAMADDVIVIRQENGPPL